MANGIPEEDRKRMLARAQTDMEALARQLRDIISVQPPKDLLGYIYTQRSLRALNAFRLAALTLFGHLRLGQIVRACAAAADVQLGQLDEVFSRNSFYQFA